MHCPASRTEAKECFVFWDILQTFLSIAFAQAKASTIQVAVMNLNCGKLN